MIDAARVIGYLLSILDMPPGRLRPENEEAWRKVFSLARGERIYYSLAGLTLQQQPSMLPPSLIPELRKELYANAARSVLLNSQISELARIFRQADIPLLFLKGGADLVRGTYPPGWRFMSDLDIMVPETHLARASSLLAEKGYHALPDGVEQVHHQPQLSHCRRVGTVELHTAPYPIGLRTKPVMSGIWERAETLSFRGDPVLIPDPTDHLWIGMRTDLIRRVTIPRLFDVIEFCQFAESGMRVNIEEIARRAREDGIPNMLSALSRACVQFGGMEPFASGDEKHLERWEEWSRKVRRKHLGNCMFQSARKRFIAAWFLPPCNCRSRFGFSVLLAKEIITVDRFTPGPYRSQSIISKIYRYTKLFFTFILSALEYHLFRWTNRTGRR